PLTEFPAIDTRCTAPVHSYWRSAISLFIARKSRVIRFACFRTFAASSLFLVCYIWYRAPYGVTRVPRQRVLRDLYLALLGSHTILAAVIVPSVLTTLHRAWRG